MPELPDLQVFSYNLDKMLAGKTVQQIAIKNGKKIKTPATTFKKMLEGDEVMKVYREGKELRFQFKSGNLLGMHLMLHGTLQFSDTKQTYKHEIAELLFTDGSALALTDYQGIATLSLNPEEKEAPDALSDDLTVAYLTERLGATRSVVKNVLLDQHVIRGIGNAYADEILWHAKISPFSVSNKIPATRIKALHKSIEQVLAQAEKQIRKSHPDLISGEVRDFLLIHHPKKTESPDGAAIEQKTTGGRKTYYTSEQELFH